MIPEFANCGYHNRVKKGETLEGREAVRHAVCREKNAFRCKNENCPGHENINN